MCTTVLNFTQYLMGRMCRAIQEVIWAMYGVIQTIQGVIWAILSNIPATLRVIWYIYRQTLWAECV